MKSKLRWLLVIIPILLFAWAYQAASWRPKAIGRPLNSILWGNWTEPASSLLLISPDGKRLVSSYWERDNGLSLAVWDAEARQQTWKQSESGEFPMMARSREWPHAIG